MSQPATIADEMEQRQKDPLADITGRIVKHTSWFGRVLPPPDHGGMAPEAFAAQLLNVVRRNARSRQPAFRDALKNDPDSFIFAATDCAALNLRPGEEYWFVPFNDRQGGTGQHFTGMPGWKGEVQQIYRSGSVEAVKFFVVYQGDLWSWKPTRMRLPDYEPKDVDHDPASLRFAVAYAEMRGGGISQVVVMGRHEIMRAKAKSKTPKDFWESEWEPEMWLKTVLHRLYDYVPHSAAYNTELMRAWAVAVERFPALQLGGTGEDDDAAIEPAAAGPAAVAGQVVPPAPPALPGRQQAASRGDPGGDDAPWPGDAQAAPADQAPAGDGSQAITGPLDTLHAKLHEAGIAQRNRREVLAAVFAGLPLPVTAAQGAALTGQQATDALDNFGQLAATKQGNDLTAALSRLHTEAIRPKGPKGQEQ